MSAVLPPLSTLPTRAQDEARLATQSLGMTIALGSWSMMFGALFFLYFGVRARAVTWPPPGVPRLPLVAPSVATLLLLASSFAFARGSRELARGRREGLAPWVALAATLGASFIALQALVWRHLWTAGLAPSSGSFGSLFYGLTVLHALHVLGGFALILAVLGRALRTSPSEDELGRVRLAGMFWHFVDAVWLMMFVSIYVL